MHAVSQGTRPLDGFQAPLTAPASYEDGFQGTAPADVGHPGVYDGRERYRSPLGGESQPGTSRPEITYGGAAAGPVSAPSQPISTGSGDPAARQPERRSREGGSPRRAHYGDACPPFGSKSVIGRRSKMEDACVAVPGFLRVVRHNGPPGEIIPPRIAPHLNTRSAARVVDGWGGEPSLTPALKAAGEPGETLHFFGVFDGHGGADAAMHCARTLHEHVAAALLPLAAKGQHEATPAQPVSDHCLGPGTPTAADTGADNDLTSAIGCGVGPGTGTLDAPSCPSEDVEAFEVALTKAFHDADEAFGRQGGYEHLALVGTTAVVVLVGPRSLYVANCGDSRAVLCRDGLALPLTEDHKAAREDETARVEAAGGQILFWNGVRVMGLLAVSRAIGDHSLRPYVIAEPEVTIVTRRAGDELLVLASDGLWDVMSNQEACTLAKKCLQRARQRGSSRQSAARVAATVLTRAAVDRGSRDNITVVVIDIASDEADEQGNSAISQSTADIASTPPAAEVRRSSEPLQQGLRERPGPPLHIGEAATGLSRISIQAGSPPGFELAPRSPFDVCPPAGPAVRARGPPGSLVSPYDPDAASGSVNTEPPALA